MVSSINIVLSPTIAAPMLIYIIITTMAIIGNAVYTFYFTNTTDNTTWTYNLWVVLSSPNSGSTATRYWNTLSNLSSGFCSYLWNLIQAGEAFAIITAILSGIALLFNVFSVVLQQKITIAKASIIGAVFSVLIFISSWIAFGTIIAIPYYSCSGSVSISSLPSFQLGPSAFMFLGTALFSVVTLACHVLTLKATQTKRPEPAAQRDQQGSPTKAPAGYGYTPQKSVAVPASPNQQQASRVVVQNQSPARYELPLPEGHDWILDESGLYWSETKKLFFDRASGQFYDPASDKWYNPEQDVWYKL